MERSEIRGCIPVRKTPDFASLHSGYKPLPPRLRMREPQPRGVLAGRAV